MKPGIPAIGPSTITMITLILGSVAAFIGTWAEGSPNVWLAAIAAGLGAALTALRSYQAVYLNAEGQQ